MKSILLLITFLTSLFAVTPFEANGQLHVDPESGKLTNESGKPVQLRGMSSHGLHWYGSAINEASIKALADHWKADVLRLSTYIQDGGYQDMPQGMTDFVDQRLELASEQGLYVIIDFHMLVPGNPWANIDHAVNFFTYMTQKHGHRKNIFYEICNEPNDHGGIVTNPYTGQHEEWDSAAVTWDIVKTYADSVISVIRKYDSTNIVLVGTPNWCQDIDEVIGNRVDDANTMYTTHFYAASHQDWYRNKLRKALDAKIPVFVSEFGTQEYSGNGFNDFESTKEWFALLDSFSVSWVNWNYSWHGFSGAVFANNPMKKDDYNFYVDDNNLKTAGRWIKEQLQKPDAWEEPAVAVAETVQKSAVRVPVVVENEFVVVRELSAGSAVTVYSLSGELLRSAKGISGEVRLYVSDLSAGVYAVRVQNGSAAVQNSLISVGK